MNVRSLAAVAAMLTSLAGTARAATPPTITVFPQVSSPTLIADGTSEYSVTMTAADVDGYNDIRCLRVLFNYTEDPTGKSFGRGYMNWGKTDADVTQWGGNWVVADATGGGRWAYHAGDWGGTTYITPVSCQTSVRVPNRQSRRTGGRLGALYQLHPSELSGG